MRHLVAFTGAGISAESGLKTFRGNDGLWEGHRVEDVATPEAFRRNPELVLNFYNERRRAVRLAEPNAAHIALKDLESRFRVTIITQNIDDLHERAGSKSVIHLHGEIFKGRSSISPDLICNLDTEDITLGQKASDGSQLRPHIVWFGESVPMMEEAARVVSRADIFLCIGTSLAVYPAASLIDFAPENCLKYLVDPLTPLIVENSGFVCFNASASAGVPKVARQLMADER